MRRLAPAFASAALTAAALTTAAALAATGLAACSSHPPEVAAPAPPAPGAPAPVPPPPAAAPAEAAGPPAPTLRLPASFVPLGYRARLRVDPAAPRFDGEIWIEANLMEASPVVWLDAEGLTVDSAEALREGSAATPMTATQTGRQFLALRADHALGAGSLTIHVAYHGTLNDDDTRGAYRKQWGGDWYVLTQFEALSARRVFPSVDEPGAKVPWQLTLDVPKGQLAVSNTPVARQAAGADGTTRFEFARTRPLPTYLIAFAVGPFETVAAGKTRAGAPIRIITPKGRAAEGRYAAAETPKIVAALEDYFGIPYPYDKLDCIAVPTNSGAMENAGLITYAETRILIDPKDPSQTRRRVYAEYAAHEIAHQWTGDLVTMAWWNDLWLNEAFATWMESKVLEKVEPSWHLDLEQVARLGGALDADSLGTARMIRQPIATEGDIGNAFDGITYGKGASVIRMFEQWVGPSTFQKGVRAYLDAHAYGNATADDFLAAIGTASGKDVATPFSTFLDQAGAPRVAAELRCEAGKPATLALHQDRYLPKGGFATGTAPLWQIPVCAVWPVGRKTATACTLLTSADGELALGDQAGCPAWAWPNAGARGYYHVSLAGPALAAVIDHGWRQLGDGEQLDVALDAAAMVRRGDADVAVALDLVPKLLAQRTGEGAVEAVALAGLAERYVPEDQWPAYQAWVRRVFGPTAHRLGWTAHHGERLDDEQARISVVPLVARAGDHHLQHEAIRLARRWKALPSSIQGPVLRVAASDGKTFEALRSQVFLETDRRARRDLLAALAAVDDPKELDDVLSLALESSLDWTQVVFLPAEVGGRPALGARAAAFTRDHLDQLIGRLPEDARADLVYGLTQACDAATRDGIEKLARTRLASYRGGKRTVEEAIERMDDCIAQKALIGPELAHYLGAK